ncbi:MAG: hypothetical protein WC575_02415 [Patescibacteria group bacterium]
MILLLSFLIMLLGVLLLSRLVNYWLSFILSQRWYQILLWPGVVIHELSHLLGALLTFTKVTGFSLLPKTASGGSVLGSVIHKATGNPATLVLISIFPFLGGSFILWVLAILLVPAIPLEAPSVLIAPDVNFLTISLNYFTAWWSFVVLFWQALAFTAWQTWLFLYLAIAIGAHLAPSNHDLGHTAAGLTAMSLLVILIVFGAELVGQSLGGIITNWLAGALNFFAPLISYSLALLIGIAILIGIVVGIKRLNNTVVWWG